MTLQTKLPGSAIQSGSIPVTAITNFSGELSASLPSNVVSSSAQVTVLLPADTVSSSVQVTAFLPVGTVSSSTQLPSGIASSSAQVIAYLPADTVSSSTQVTTFLPTNTVSSSGQVTAFLPTGTVSSSGQVGEYPNIATTGSNTFVGIQTISDTTNSTSYLDGALTVAGGMSVRKDVRVSGSLTVNGLLTAVSMSTQYVTSSEYTIGTSKIILNDDDLVRFAGLSIVDSGSASPATASIFWDSLQHRFIYENLSGSSYNSSILIAGPKHTGTLGDEVGLTDFRIPVAHGSDHIDSRPASSSIRVDFPSRLTHVEAGLYVTGAISASGETVISGDLTVDTTTFKVDSTNNRVGIGTASPSYTLDVDRGASNGVAAKLGRSSGQAAYVYVDTTSVYLGSDATGNTSWQFNESSDYLAAFTAGNERLRLDASGNLGLGVTPSGGYKLEVNGIVLASVIEIGEMSAFLSNSTNAAIGWASSFSGYDNGTLILQPRSSAARPIVFATGNTTPTERMRLDASGNLAVDTNTLYVDAANDRVGIGTASPASLLNLHAAAPELIVNGTGVSNFGVKIRYSSSSSHGLHLTYTPQDATAYIDNAYPVTSGYVYGDIYFRQNVSGTMTTRMTIKADGGNVGIGTTSPGYKLDVLGTGATLARFVASSGNDALVRVIASNYSTEAKARVFLGENDNLGMTVEYDGVSNIGYVGMNNGVDPTGAYSKRIQMSRVGTEVAFMAGNVGIGTTSPTALLHAYSDTSATVLIRGANGNIATTLGFNHGGGGGRTAVNGQWNISFGSAETNFGFSPNLGGGLAFWHQDGGTINDVMRLKTDNTALFSGKVGIGTASPAAKLGIEGTAGSGVDGGVLLDLYGGTISSADNGVGISFTRATSQLAYIQAARENASNEAAYLRFATQTSAGTHPEYMRITSTGVFLVGATNTDVGGSVAGTRINQNGTMTVSFNDASPANYQSPIAADRRNTAGDGLMYGMWRQGIIQCGIGATNSQAMTFITGDGSNNIQTERMRITSGGSVGIGTTVPRTTLDIRSDTTSATTVNNGITLLNASGVSDTMIGIRYSTYGNAEGHQYPKQFIGAIRDGSAGGGKGQIVFCNRDANDESVVTLADERMRITSSGNVGIGTTNPGAKLHVPSGNVQFVFDGSTENTSNYFYVGKNWSATNHRINRQVTQGNVILVLSAYGASSVTADTAIFYSINSGGANGAATALELGSNSSTSRSLNAGGTINASGADYAEYMTKNGDFNLSKGDICGVDTNGKLTNKFSKSHSFVVKSTNPSYVGGDTWGNEQSVGQKPYLTTQDSDESEEDYAVRVAQHNADMEEFNIVFENARKLVDRIAFSGQVPVNVYNANVGDYIIPLEGAEDTITGLAVASPSFEQYQKAVGKVWKILEDGRALISVKIG